MKQDSSKEIQKEDCTTRSEPASRTESKLSGKYKWERLAMEYEEDFQDVGGEVTFMQILDDLLKRPATLVYQLSRTSPFKLYFALTCISIFCMLAYGFVTGMFSSGHQLWAVPLKFLMIAVFTSLICLPSLYIFTCLAGCQQGFLLVAGLLLLLVSLTGLLLIGFVPVTWIFSISTHSIVFMGILHLLTWIVSVYFGTRLLFVAFMILNQRPVHVLQIWAVIYFLVVMQMATTLRPLVGEWQGFKQSEKKFFFTHWKETINAPESTDESKSATTLDR